MILDFEIQTGFWIVLPRDFPTAEGMSEDEWFDAFIEPYAEAYGTMDDEVTTFLRSVIAEMRQNILDQDVATILYRPLNVPVFGLLHLQMFDGGDIDLDRAVREGLLPDALMALPPVVETWETEKLGSGTKAAFLLFDPTPDGTLWAV